jgi:hypothetical protein
MTCVCDDHEGEGEHTARWPRYEADTKLAHVLLYTIFQPLSVHSIPLILSCGTSLGFAERLPVVSVTLNITFARNSRDYTRNLCWRRSCLQQPVYKYERNPFYILGFKEEYLWNQTTMDRPP